MSLPLSRPESNTDTDVVIVSLGADVGVGVNRAENTDIIVVHIGTAGTSRWRERHEIEHGLNLSEKSKHEKVMSDNEEETYNAHIVAIRE